MQAVFTSKNKGFSHLYERKFTQSYTTSRGVCLMVVGTSRGSWVVGRGSWVWAWVKVVCVKNYNPTDPIGFSISSASP